MLKLHLGKWTPNSTLFFPATTTFSLPPTTFACTCSSSGVLLKIKIKRAFTTLCRARRRAIYDDNEDDKEYGYNEELAMLEMYTQLVKDEILLVDALVDGEKVEVLIFKGFSSCLNYKTFSNPSRSVLPAKALIQNIDRAKAPFDPSNVQYIQKGLSFDEFKSRLSTQS